MKLLSDLVKEQKSELYEILIGAALLLLAWIAPITGAVRAIVFIAIYIFAAREVLLGMVKEAKEGEIFTEETLMSVATIGALILGEFPEAVAVMLLYRLGEWFADLAVDKSRDSISALAELRPDTARVIRDGSESVVPAETVQVGEIIVLLPGERVPLDAEIVSAPNLNAECAHYEQMILEARACPGTVRREMRYSPPA